jgi:hypothetical protein
LGCDAFLAFNEREVLTHAGQVSAQIAEQLALERYAQFEAQRRKTEQQAADAEDTVLLERVERVVQRRASMKKRGGT